MQYSGPSVIRTHWALALLDNRKVRKSNLLEYLLPWICQLQTPLPMMQASRLFDSLSSMHNTVRLRFAMLAIRVC